MKLISCDSATPYFANRINISGDAGIAGNNQDPINWGAPTARERGPVIGTVSQLGQRNVPKLNMGVAAESALTMDFAPKDATRGALSFTIERPGFYLLRLETRGAATVVFNRSRMR